jgi:predicted transcriptional regulator
MAPKSDKFIALISVHPTFAHKILTGSKKVEFRKTRFRKDVSHIVIYSTAPEKKLLGFFEVTEIEEGTPSTLWQRYRKCSGIDKIFYSTYYNSNKKGYAIKIGNVYKLDKPKNFSCLKKFKSPPQNFCYLDSTSFSRLVKA